MKKVLPIACGALMYSAAFAQESGWEPKLHTTGYLTATAEYTDQKWFKEENKNVAVGLAEAGLLASYKPLEKLELKTTLVYSHQMVEFQSMLVEASAMYSFSKAFRVGTGKFLTPLSPINTYFYAPLNPSGTLPMLVAHHYLTPQSISGIQVAGAFGDDFGVEYNLTYGNYTTYAHDRGGVMGLIGNEDFAAIPERAHKTNDKQQYDLGGSARLAVDYKKMFSLGGNLFHGTRSTIGVGVIDPAAPGGGYKLYPVSRRVSYGVDAHLNLFDENLKVNGEYWVGSNKTTSLVDAGAAEELTLDMDGYYAEAIYKIGKFSPFVRYESISDAKAIIYAKFPTMLINEANVRASSVGGGIAYRPIYEVLIKADVRMLDINCDAGAEAVGGEDMKYLHTMLSAVFSF